MSPNAAWICAALGLLEWRALLGMDSSRPPSACDLLSRPLKTSWLSRMARASIARSSSRFRGAASGVGSCRLGGDEAVSLPEESLDASRASCTGSHSSSSSSSPPSSNAAFIAISREAAAPPPP